MGETCAKKHIEKSKKTNKYGVWTYIFFGHMFRCTRGLVLNIAMEHDVFRKLDTMIFQRHVSLQQVFDFFSWDGRTVGRHFGLWTAEITRRYEGQLWTFVWNDIPGWWFGTFLIFPYIGFLIIPIDVHIFPEGWPNHQPDIRLVLPGSQNLCAGPVNPVHQTSPKAVFPGFSIRGAMNNYQ